MDRVVFDRVVRLRDFHARNGVKLLSSEIPDEEVRHSAGFSLFQTINQEKRVHYAEQAFYWKLVVQGS